MEDYISRYKRLPEQDKTTYKRIAKLRYYAEINNCKIKKLYKVDSYLITDGDGEPHFARTLDDAEKFFVKINRGFKK